MRTKVIGCLLAFLPIFASAQKTPPLQSMPEMQKADSSLPPIPKVARAKTEESYCTGYEEKCPNGIKDVEVCFMGPNTYDGDIRIKMPSLRYCGRNSLMFHLTEEKHLAQAFETLKSQCARIKNFKVMTHGSEGKIDLFEPPTSAKDFKQKFGRYSCMMAADATIDLAGCNVGKGCRGEDMIDEIAKTMLPRGGTVTANTDYAGVYLSLLTPTSQNLERRRLEYHPERSPASKWYSQGAITDRKTEKKLNPKVCAAELKEVREKYNDISEAAAKRGCKLKYNSRLTQYALELELNHDIGKVPENRMTKEYSEVGKPQLVEYIDMMEREIYQFEKQCPESYSSKVLKGIGIDNSKSNSGKGKTTAD